VVLRECRSCLKATARHNMVRSLAALPLLDRRAASRAAPGALTVLSLLRPAQPQRPRVSPSTLLPPAQFRDDQRSIPRLYRTSTEPLPRYATVVGPKPTSKEDEMALRARVLAALGLGGRDSGVEPLRPALGGRRAVATHEPRSEA